MVGAAGAASAGLVVGADTMACAASGTGAAADGATVGGGSTRLATVLIRGSSRAVGSTKPSAFGRP